MTHSTTTSILFAAACLGAFGCSSAPNASPDASTSAPASVAPAETAPAEVTCATVSERAGGTPERHVSVALGGASPAIARATGYRGVSVASAITQTTFSIVDPLNTNLALDATTSYTRHGSGPLHHPNVEPSRSMLDNPRVQEKLSEELFVVLVDAGGLVTRYVPALDEREAHAMGALLAADMCAATAPQAPR